MANILCVWELGGELGHVANLAACAKAFKAEGHTVTVVLKELEHAHAFFKDLSVSMLQAPVYRARNKPKVKTANMAEILGRRGYDDTDILMSLISAWGTIYELVKPDVIVFDYAPTALLAARSMDVKRIILANAQMIQPTGSPQLDFRPKAPMFNSRTRESEKIIVDNINSVSGCCGFGAINFLSDIYDAECVAVYTIEELDPFINQRTNEYYIGALDVGGSFPGPVWSGQGGKKVFAYIKPYTKQFKSVMSAIGGLGLNCCSYCPSISKEDLEYYQSDNHIIYTSPLDVQIALSKADLFICHAGGSVIQALISATPVICMPTQLEQMRTSRLVTDLGYGKMIKAEDTDKAAAMKIAAVLNDAECGRRVSELSCKYADRGNNYALNFLIKQVDDWVAVDFAKNK